MTCTHLHTCFRALSAETPLPGVFECKDCGGSFVQDPNNPNGVRYLAGPNPAATKKVTLTPEEHLGKKP